MLKTVLITWPPTYQYPYQLKMTTVKLLNSEVKISIVLAQKKGSKSVVRDRKFSFHIIRIKFHPNLNEIARGDVSQ